MNPNPQTEPQTFTGPDNESSGGFEARVLARMQEMRANPASTGPGPRPTGKEPEHQYLSPIGLQRLQEQWDRDQNIRTIAAGIEQRIANEKAAAKTAQDEHLAGLRAAEQERELEPAKAAFLAAGGTLEEWEREKPGIIGDLRRERAVAAARDAQSAGGVRSLVSRFGA